MPSATFTDGTVAYRTARAMQARDLGVRFEDCYGTGPRWRVTDSPSRRCRRHATPLAASFFRGADAHGRFAARRYFELLPCRRRGALWRAACCSTPEMLSARHDDDFLLSRLFLLSREYRPHDAERTITFPSFITAADMLSSRDRSFNFSCRAFEGAPLGERVANSLGRGDGDYLRRYAQKFSMRAPSRAGFSFECRAAFRRFRHASATLSRLSKLGVAALCFIFLFTAAHDLWRFRLAISSGRARRQQISAADGLPLEV